jgi:hypothetical protein
MICRRVEGTGASESTPGLISMQEVVSPLPFEDSRLDEGGVGRLVVKTQGLFPAYPRNEAPPTLTIRLLRRHLRPYQRESLSVDVTHSGR